ncbi:MAG: heme o synthase [Planctomycetota bacterium]|nr:heme o synthase [Planctomycetota bacterium]MCX8039870.1 heme o synthase [Planctomycetota bacterium]
MLGALRDLLRLAKFRITLVAVFTGYTAIAVHGAHATDVAFLWPLFIALFATGASANALNQICDRHRDALMARTRQRRPLPAGRIGLGAALAFALAMLALAIAILLAVYHSPLAALCSVITVVYYAVIYTWWLKPRHWIATVVGGVPGAMGPLIAWAAVDHALPAAAWALFALIFLWTPPHVWALAIRLREDYARAGIPMLPVVRGIDATTRQMLIYGTALVLFTIALPLLPAYRHSWIYLALACVLGAVFLGWCVFIHVRRPVPPTMPLFRFTIAHLALLFLALIVDAFVWSK